MSRSFGESCRNERGTPPFPVGCPDVARRRALGPNYTPPVPPQGAGAPFVSASPAATTATEVPNDWWQLYDDPVLNSLIDQAFERMQTLNGGGGSVGFPCDL